VELYRNALSIDPTWAEAWSDCGRAYEGMSYDLARAENVSAAAVALVEGAKCMVTAADLDPTNPTTIGDRAYVREMGGDWEGCRRDHAQTATMVAGSLEQYEALGMLALFSRDFPAAVTYMAKSCQIQPSETDFF